MDTGSKSDPGPANPEGTLSEEEVRKYVEKLRSTPAQQIVVEMLFNAVNAAQVKLGRKDARLFIDLSALLVDRLSAYLPDEAKTQVDQALQQLRLAQVQAENQRTGKDQPEPNDLDRAPTGIAPSSTASGAKSTAGGGAPAATTSAQPRTSKLWVPGQSL